MQGLEDLEYSFFQIGGVSKSFTEIDWFAQNSGLLIASKYPLTNLHFEKIKKEHRGEWTTLKGFCACSLQLNEQSNIFFFVKLIEIIAQKFACAHKYREGKKSPKVFKEFLSHSVDFFSRRYSKV